MNRPLIPRLACLILFLALPTIVPCPVLAQTPTLAVDKVAGLPGTTVDVAVSLTTGASPVSSLQFDVMLPSSLAWVSTATGSAASSAGKDVSSAAHPGRSAGDHLRPEPEFDQRGNGCSCETPDRSRHSGRDAHGGISQDCRLLAGWQRGIPDRHIRQRHRE